MQMIASFSAVLVLVPIQPHCNRLPQQAQAWQHRIEYLGSKKGNTFCNLSYFVGGNNVFDKHTWSSFNPRFGLDNIRRSMAVAIGEPLGRGSKSFFHSIRGRLRDVPSNGTVAC